MTAGDLLGSAAVAAVVSGIFVFTYQQWLQTRLRRIEAKLERERSYEEHTNELLVTAYRKIWAGLIDIEYWLRHGLMDEISNTEVVNPEQWSVFFETYKSFRAEMLFLPEMLYDRTLKLIRGCETNLNGLLDVLREVITAKEEVVS
jgi:hypothetical protein